MTEQEYRNPRTTIDWSTQGMTVLSVFVGGIIAFGANYFLQAQLFQQEAAKDAKAERRKIYTDYSDKVTAFNNSTASLKSCLTGSVATTTPVNNWKVTCQTEILAYQQSTRDFQNALNQLFIYGSDQAVEKALALAAPLPPSGNGSSILTNPTTLEKVIAHDPHAIDQPFKVFGAVACRELPATPRAACTMD